MATKRKQAKKKKAELEKSLPSSKPQKRDYKTPIAALVVLWLVWFFFAPPTPPPDVTEQEVEAMTEAEPVAVEFIDTLPFPQLDTSNPQAVEYAEKWKKARVWWNNINQKIQAVPLAAQGIKGVKKVGESLDLAVEMVVYQTTSEDRHEAMANVHALLQQVNEEEYHQFMHTCTPKQFNQNSMSYFRVLKLMKKLRLNTTFYMEKLLELQPRMDDHLERRGAWQLQMFGKYYDLFNLEKPYMIADMEELEKANEIIPKQVPLEQLTKINQIYVLTHEMYVMFEYGLKEIKRDDVLSEEDVKYLRIILPGLAKRYMAQNNADILGEIVSCFQYAEIEDEPTYKESIDWLINAANPDGSWGDPNASPHMQIMQSLHTVSVVGSALNYEFYGPIWKYMPPIEGEE